jgi:Uma2 family endonuclease
LEPDQCYYFRDIARVLSLDRLDLTRDPPPDLAVEIDVTQSSVDRLAIYATLGVPEVWRFHGGRMSIFVLAANGRYEDVETSRSFPRVPIPDLPRFVNQGMTEGDLPMARAFRAWVREQLKHR